MQYKGIKKVMDEVIGSTEKVDEKVNISEMHAKI